MPAEFAMLLPMDINIKLVVIIQWDKSLPLMVWLEELVNYQLHHYLPGSSCRSSTGLKVSGLPCWVVYCRA